jgi:multicomponent K+:H+ antiporter subunit E
VVWDIIVSNVHRRAHRAVQAADQIRRCLGDRALDTDLARGGHLLAGTITMTPGTLTADMSADGRALLIHCCTPPTPTPSATTSSRATNPG